ncbi:uncharacterized protein LOC131153598 [Malania oleifera]|uniref:uncharacterized protein LOC131153598 n=1 Tax=Malania oleifera TaxID=397392 RepID=UPI0025AE23AC|nr:uncharacterized protein LOC131153598 [Malania oleifera]
MDERTKLMRNLQSARVCVEVDMERNLLECISIKMPSGSLHTMDVWKPSLFTGDKKLGHLMNDCVAPNVWKPKTNQAFSEQHLSSVQATEELGKGKSSIVRQKTESLAIKKGIESINMFSMLDDPEDDSPAVPLAEEATAHNIGSDKGAGRQITDDSNGPTNAGTKIDKGRD